MENVDVLALHIFFFNIGGADAGAVFGDGIDRNSMVNWKCIWDGEGFTQAFLDLHCPNMDGRCFNIASVFLFSEQFLPK